MWRTLDVGAVAGSLPVSDARVVAGQQGLGRFVGRARLVSDDDQLRRLTAGDLGVMDARTLCARAELDALFAGFEAAHVAGLVVRVGPGEPLPDEVAAAAERVSLPLIAFDGDGSAGLADVTSTVLDALLEAQRQRLEQFLDVHHRFTRIVLSGGGAPEIASTLHVLLRHPVAVVDHEGRPIVVVPADADLPPPEEAGPLRQRISSGDQEYGEIQVYAGGSDIGPNGSVALERAATAIAVRLAQARAVAEAQERFAAVSLEELISGHGQDMDDITERAMAFGWDLARPRAVLLASVDPPEEGPVPTTALDTIAAAARATLGRDAIVWTRSATIAALLAPDTDDPAERRAVAEALRRELDVRLRSVTVSIGVGRRVETPDLLHRSFLEARRAVDVGRWAKGRHVTELFDELGLERLLAATPGDYLAEFVQTSIGPLIEHDRRHGTDLVDTLAAWLDTRNMAEAARRIHVHYNTMKNRLDRIESIIGPVVSDSARALECEVATYVARHYGIGLPDGDDGV